MKVYYIVPAYSHYLPHRVVYGIVMTAFDRVHPEGIIKLLDEDLTLVKAKARLKYWRARE